MPLLSVGVEMNAALTLAGAFLIASSIVTTASAEMPNPNPLDGHKVTEIAASDALLSQGNLYGLGDNWCAEAARLILILKPANVGRVVGYAALIDTPYQILTIKSACPKARSAVVEIFDPIAPSPTDLTPLPADHAPWREVAPVTIQLSKSN